MIMKKNKFTEMIRTILNSEACFISQQKGSINSSFLIDKPFIEEDEKDVFIFDRNGTNRICIPYGSLTEQTESNVFVCAGIKIECVDVV